MRAEQRNGKAYSGNDSRTLHRAPQLTCDIYRYHRRRYNLAVGMLDGCTCLRAMVFEYEYVLESPVPGQICDALSVHLYEFPYLAVRLQGYWF